MEIKMENPYSDLGNDVVLKKSIKEIYLPVFEILIIIIIIIGITFTILSIRKLKASMF